MPDKTKFKTVFQELRSILKPYAPRMVVVTDDSSTYYLDTSHVMKNKKPLFFAAVRLGKAYVSYYLMPLYFYPVLSEAISPALKKRRQGKSCFNFTSVEKLLFKELANLTKLGYSKYEAEKYI